MPVVSFKWFQNNYFVRNLGEGLRLMLSEPVTRFYFSILVVILLLGIFGPIIAPYPHDANLTNEKGELLSGSSPSLSHPLGTTDIGQDVLSRVLYGARPTVITGLLGGALITSIGLTVGVTAGYLGGIVDDVLMRITDIFYGIPLLPFAIVILAFLGIGFITSIVVLGLILWRGSARVIRSQVLQIRERPYVLAARATGIGTPRIIVKHIIPNIAPMAVLFFSLGVGYTIVLQAGLSFLGLTNPAVPTWGVMVRNAYSSGLMSSAWWWSLTPGFMISLTVLSSFMFGRGYEATAGSIDEDVGISL